MIKPRKVAVVSVIILLLSIFLLPVTYAWSAGTGKGSITGMVYIPSDSQYRGTLEVKAVPLGRTALDGGGGGGGDGGGGGGGGDGGYYDPGTVNFLSPFVIQDNRIVNLENVTAGLYNLILEYGNQGEEKYQLSLKNIRVVENQITDLKNLMLKKGGSITGQIRYSGIEGCPTKTATVHVVGFTGNNYQDASPLLKDKAITATDLGCNFTLTGLPEGTYTIAITPSDATFAREVITNIRVESGKTTGATPFGPMELTSTIGPLKGKVTLIDKISTGPHSGTYVRATSTGGRYRSYLQMTTDTGAFDFGFIPRGVYALFVQHPGYKVSESEVEVKDTTTSQTIYLENGLRKICGRATLSGAEGNRGDVNGDLQVNLADAIVALQISIGMKPAVTLSTASDINADGKIGLAEALHALQAVAGLRHLSSTLAGTLVSVPGTSLIAVTDAGGNFAVENVPDRGANDWLYDIFVMRDGYQAVRQAVQATTDCNYGNLPIELARNTTVVVGGQVVPTGSITGRAWLKNDPDPSTIDIAIDGTSLTSKPNGSGNYVLNQVPPGNYRLRYSSTNYKTVVEAGVQVVADRSIEVRNVVLVRRNGTIKGRVTLKGASSVEGVDIAVLPIAAQVGTYPTDSQGNFSIPVPENFNPITNEQCVPNIADKGQCTATKAYSLTITKPGYNTLMVSAINVPAGEATDYAVDLTTGVKTVDLNTLQLLTPPLPPSGVSAVQKDGSSVTVSWTASPSADVAGYNVYYGTASDQITTKANTSLIATQTGGKWQFTVTGLEKGILYYFVAQAGDRDNLTSAKAPGDGSCTGILVPQGANIPEVLCANCSFGGAILSDIALIGDGSKGYVSSAASTSVYLIDFSTGIANESDKIVIGTSAQPRALAYNPFRNELYVVNATIGAPLRTIDTTTNTLKTGSIAVGAAPKNVIVSPDGATIYVCSSYSGQNRVTVIDAATGATNTIPFLDDIDPYGMAIAANKLYVVGQSSGRVYVIDLNSASPNYRTVIKNINAGGGAYETIARPDGAFIYVSLNDNIGGAIAVIDTATDQLVGNPIPVGMNPQGMAVSGNILYVTNYYGTNHISMINTATNTKLETGTIASGGTGPITLAVSPDGNKLYVVHGGSVTIVSY